MEMLIVCGLALGLAFLDWQLIRWSLVVRLPR